MPSTLRYQVRQERGTFWVEDTRTGERVTAREANRYSEDKKRRVLLRPCAKERVRKIAKRMNRRERQGAS